MLSPLIERLFEGVGPSVGVRRTVANTAEWHRVNALPRRPANVVPAEYVEGATTLLKRPHGTQKLFPVQAWAVYEMLQMGGLLAPIGVGEGKTLISALAPLVLGSLRPLLLLPANLLAKTDREFRLLAVHWRVPNHVRMLSYEVLSRVSSAVILDSWRPDLIVADECHRLRHDTAAVTKRVKRFFREHPETKFVGLSGTMTDRSIRDYAHLAEWALGAAGMPLPCLDRYPELIDWADALDESYKGTRPEPGALRAWSVGQSGELGAVREGYQRRFRETPGIVTTGGKRLHTGLEITAMPIEQTSVVTDAFRALREGWERPDGELLIDGPAVWSCARTLALGFFYRWSPAPPPDWREARRLWAKECRYVLGHNRSGLDSELQVKQAIRAGSLPSSKFVLDQWEKIQPTFEPNPVPQWICDHPLSVAIEWAKKHTGIIWTQQRAFGYRLAAETKLDYYGAEGVNAAGRPIDLCDGKRTIIVSTKANCEGRNLQAFAVNLETSPSPNAKEWEQKIGRTHRTGQRCDTVTFDVMMGCAEHLQAWDDAIARAQYILQTEGTEQRILYATTDMVLPPKGGPVWDRDYGKDD